MSDAIFSFVFDRRGALAAFPGVSVGQCMMAILARIPPPAAWEGCLVYTGPTPLDPDTTVCVGTRGPGADQAQQRLVEQFEALGISVLAVYEGGPEQTSPLARVGEGRWCGT